MSIVGTFAVMYLLGYSLDNLSLMALTLVGRLRRRRRHRDAREHRPPHGDGQDAAAGRARRLARDRLHDPLDDAVAGRRCSSRCCSWAGSRPAVPRVRGHHRRRDPGLGLRLADADADAVQPLPQRRRTTQQHGRVLQGHRARASSASLARLRAQRSRWVMRHRRVGAGVLARRSSSAPSCCSCSSPRGSSRARTPASSPAPPRRPRAPRSRRWCAHQQAVAAIVAAGPERRGVHVVGRAAAARGGRATRAACSSASSRARERTLERRRGRSRQLQPQARAGPGHPRVPAEPAADPHRRPRRPRASTSSRCRAPTSTQLYATRAAARGDAARRCRGCTDVTSDLQIKNPQVSVDDRPRPRRRARRHARSRSRTRSTTPTARGRSRPSSRRNNQYQVIMELLPAVPARPRRRCDCSTCARANGDAGAARRAWPRSRPTLGPADA